MEARKKFTRSSTSVSHAQALEVARDARMPVFKARSMSLNNDCTLDENEILVANQSIETNVECAMVLAQLGCSEDVLVLEGLDVLEKEFDDCLEFEVCRNEYRQDCELIFSLASKGSLDKLRLFEVAKQKRIRNIPLSKEESDACTLNIGGSIGGTCKFVRGLILAAKEVKCYDQIMVELKAKVHYAARTSGSEVFKNVILNMMEKHQHTKDLFAKPLTIFNAWSEVYERRIKRNIKNHLFLVTQLDVETAERALVAFEFLINSHPTLQPLMQATVPLIYDRLKGIEVRTKLRKAELEKNIAKGMKLLSL